MQTLDLTLPTPQENLALDEALLDDAEAAGAPTETLRLWEPATWAVVVGRSSKIAEEVQEAACQEAGVPVLRRASGGAAVVTGPGCLMYAVVLSYRLHPALRMVDHAHQFVLETLSGALRREVPTVERQGISDLVLGGRKFSGNSVRCKRRHLLYHGTLLYAMRLERIARYLKMPPRQPDYRDGRPHAAFVANLPLDGPTLRRTVIEAWQAHQPCADWPRQPTARLVAEKYGRAEWHEGRLKGL